MLCFQSLSCIIYPHPRNTTQTTQNNILLQCKKLLERNQSTGSMFHIFKDQEVYMGYTHVKENGCIEQRESPTRRRSANCQHFFKTKQFRMNHNMISLPRDRIKGFGIANYESFFICSESNNTSLTFARTIHSPYVPKMNY